VNPRYTDELVADLARDLGPVRPVARLRVVGLSALALWCAAVGLGWLLDGQRPAPGLWSWGHFAGLAGLGVAGLGGLAASLASAIPGREETLRRARYAMIWGVAAALAAGVSALWGVDSQSYAGSLGCVVRSIALGVAPLLILGWFLARGAVSSQRLASCLALIGSIGLGAVAVQATCPTLTGGHVLLGHTIGPLAVAVVASFPLASVLARGSALVLGSNAASTTDLTTDSTTDSTTGESN
jgi:hypothetical protein